MKRAKTPTRAADPFCACAVHRRGGRRRDDVARCRGGMRWPAEAEARPREERLSRDRSREGLLRITHPLSGRQAPQREDGNMKLTKKSNRPAVDKPATRAAAGPWTAAPSCAIPGRRRRRGGGRTDSPGMMRRAKAQTPAAGQGRRQDRFAPSAPTARSAAASMPRCRTACGSARSRPSIIRSTWVRTAPRARRCASTATASGA